MGNKLALQTLVPTSVCYVQPGSVGEEQGGCAGWVHFFPGSMISSHSQGKENG